MEFRTIVDIPKPDFEIRPCDEILMVGSCFADEMGKNFRDNAFPVTVNPYGVMYNPASILHTVQRSACAPRVAFLTLGTNHVYRLKSSGEIVDNCEKRPQALFQEEQLSVDACADYLQRAVDTLRQRRPDVQVVLTVSPIRYRKYGYVESQRSKATLLLAAHRVQGTTYFPAYEILMDELRDYRFYAPDMLHPSAQAVDYIWERLVDVYFSEDAKTYLREWQPLRQALTHRPFHPDSADYQQFLQQTQERLAVFKKKYPNISY